MIRRTISLNPTDKVELMQFITKGATLAYKDVGRFPGAEVYSPAAKAETGVEALILDAVYRLLEIVPMHLGLPYIQIWNVLHFDFSASTPLTLYSWPHETSSEALARNAAGLQILSQFYTGKSGRRLSRIERLAHLAKGRIRRI